MLLLGDFSVEQRPDPGNATVHVRETFDRADVVYGNLEGLLVKSEGPDKDIPDKSGWQHIGPEAVQALRAGNIHVVGVANNVAYGPANILKSLAVLDANGIAHTGAGANLEEAHKPAIVERKGVRIGFLQYTAKWYREDQQIATAYLRLAGRPQRRSQRRFGEAATRNAIGQADRSGGIECHSAASYGGRT